MRARDLEANVIMHNAAIRACGKGKQWQRSLELINQKFLRRK